MDAAVVKMSDEQGDRMTQICHRLEWVRKTSLFAAGGDKV
jgi:hypothetical protein